MGGGGGGGGRSRVQLVLLRRHYLQASLSDYKNLKYRRSSEREENQSFCSKDNDNIPS